MSWDSFIKDLKIQKGDSYDYLARFSDKDVFHLRDVIIYRKPLKGAPPLSQVIGAKLKVLFLINDSSDRPRYVQLKMNTRDRQVKVTEITQEQFESTKQEVLNR